MNCNLAAQLKTLNHAITLIGYGNDLRSDDGVGQRVAETVAHWGVASVNTLATQQLTPEIAETLADSQMAIFVDAYPAEENSTVKVIKLEPAATLEVGDHTSDPTTLLALAQKLYGHTPEAWLIAIPATNFELGETLSPLAEIGMSDALEEIDYLIRHQLEEVLPKQTTSNNS